MSEFYGKEIEDPKLARLLYALDGVLDAYYSHFGSVINDKLDGPMDKQIEALNTAKADFTS